jgi:hypothetical protein
MCNTYTYIYIHTYIYVSVYAHIIHIRYLCVQGKLVELKRFISESKNKDNIHEKNNDQKLLNHNNCINNDSDNNNDNKCNNTKNNDNNDHVRSDESNKINPEKNSKLSDLQKLTYRMSLQLNLKPKLRFDINQVDCDYLRTALHYACKFNHYDVRIIYIYLYTCI